jgi:hypothetical protein
MDSDTEKYDSQSSKIVDSMHGSYSSERLTGIFDNLSDVQHRRHESIVEKLGFFRKNIALGTSLNPDVCEIILDIYLGIADCQKDLISNTNNAYEKLRCLAQETKSLDGRLGE